MVPGTLKLSFDSTAARDVPEKNRVRSPPVAYTSSVRTGLMIGGGGGGSSPHPTSTGAANAAVIQ